VIDAEKDVKNFVRLSKLQSISEEKLRKARLLLAHAQKTLLQAKAKLNETEADLPYLRLKSPVKAQLVKRLVDPGDLATPGMPLLNLEAVSPIIFETSIPVHWVSKIKKGQQVNIKFYHSNKEIVAFVKQIISSADPLTQTCVIKLRLPPSLKVSTGLFGQAQFIIDQEPLLTIPEKALVDRVGISGVFRLDEQNMVWFMPVRYGRKYKNKRVILAGLERNDKVILSPSDKLRDGIQIIQANK
jgi:RND family efflux transporter MFP subunit